MLRCAECYAMQRATPTTRFMPHRLFIAVDLPEDVRRRLASLVAHAVLGVRPVRAEQVHLTLHFLGDADDASLAHLAAALANLGQEPFTIDLAGTGVFPPQGRPTVLWTGVTACEPLRQLHGRVAAVLVACDFPVESRPWVPHVTLARLSPRVPTTWTKQFLERHRDLAQRALPVTAGRRTRDRRVSRDCPAPATDIRIA